MSSDTRIVAGTMSGTSADGVDVALVLIRGRAPDLGVRLLHHHHRPFDPLLRQAVLRCRSAAAVSLRELAELGRQISLVYAAAVNETLAAGGYAADQIAAIAAHGQTLFHDPPLTIQWLDPSLLAAETGCAVVSDFRRADCAAGGQGAPLVPFADHILLRHPSENRAFLNIGGIANITFLPASGGIDATAAFDTGPGNCISDHLMRELHPAGPGYDAGGVLAAAGRPIEAVALRFLSHPYFLRPPPKSTDTPTMIDLYHEAAGDLGGTSRLPDHLATACLITATAVARALRDFLPTFPDRLLVSGGGVHNTAMMKTLRDLLSPLPVEGTQTLGVPAEAKEAIAFALLGAATLDGRPGNVPAATGARRPVVLGSITPRP